jgi:hypothetical protein
LRPGDPRLHRVCLECPYRKRALIDPRTGASIEGVRLAHSGHLWPATDATRIRLDRAATAACRLIEDDYEP